MLLATFSVKVVEEGLNDLRALGAGGPASNPTLTIQVDVVGHSRYVVVTGDTSFRVEDVLEGEAAVVNKTLGQA